MKKKVLIPTKLDKVAANTLNARENYEVIQDDSGDVAALSARHPDAYAMIVRSEKVTSAIMDALPGLKVVVRAGAGYDNIDTKYARSRGIDVLNTPGANANAVAEEVIAMMLADARHLIPADLSTRAGKWEKNSFMGREITGKTIGIVGLGNIGRCLAKRLSSFDMRMLGYDPVCSADRAAEFGVELVDLPTVFAKSDYVTFHLPETKETRGMLNETFLSMMKDGATIINCARAVVIDEAALRKVKKEKKLRFLNDVYEEDAAGPKSIADIADVMMPHLGASTVQANVNAARRAAEELIELTEKGIASFVVNRDIPQGLDESYCKLANTLARLCKCLLGPDASLKSIETSIYGTLEPYADWLIVPMVAGIWPDFEVSLEHKAAREYLEEMGIGYTNRKTDPSKGYGGSITIDMTGAIGSGNLRKASVRGTVTENNIMVARINEFDKLYFEPVGNTAFFLYKDRPGVIGAIGLGMAKAGINIEDMRNPHDPRTNHSLAVVKINKRVPPGVLESLSAEIDALAAFHIEL